MTKITKLVEASASSWSPWNRLLSYCRKQKPQRFCNFPWRPYCRSQAFWSSKNVFGPLTLVIAIVDFKNLVLGSVVPLTTFLVLASSWFAKFWVFFRSFRIALVDVLSSLSKWLHSISGVFINSKNWFFFINAYIGGQIFFILGLQIIIRPKLGVR